MQGFPVLEISDGTTTIDLLARSGLRLRGWSPRAQASKGGGVRNDSGLADNSALVMTKLENIGESFALVARGFDEDDLYRVIGDLLRLLNTAVEYWTTSWSQTPVYLRARGPKETNDRYATITSYGFPGITNPNAQTIFQCLTNSFTEVDLNVEHLPWQSVAPGQDTCVEAGGGAATRPLNYTVLRPTQSSDDAFVAVDTATITLNSAELRFGKNGAGSSLHSGVRFRAPGIPILSTVRAAFVRFRAESSDAAVTVNALIRYEQAAAPAIFSTYADFMARTRGAITYAWNNVGAWVAGSTYDTPDIKDVVQGAINSDLVFFNPSQDIVLFFEDNGSSVTGGLNARRPFSWNAPDGEEPELHIWWEEPTKTVAMGQEATCSPNIYIANKDNQTQLTHIYIDDGGVFGANLAYTYPHNLLPAAPANGDAVYFGVSSFSPYAGPFSSLVFDVGVAATYADAGDLIIWEYWDGAAWTAIDVFDDTVIRGGAYSYGAAGGKPWGRTGVNSVRWGWDPAGPAVSDWAVTSVNGQTGWWVRARVVEVNAVSTPTQVGRPVYTVSWASALIDAGQVPGDLPMRARVRIFGAGTGAHRYVLGLRSTSRDTALYPFNAFINLSGAQWLPGMQQTLGGGYAYVGGTGNIGQAGTGSWVSGNIAGGSSAQVGISMNGDVSQSYAGTYHAYLRYVDAPTGGAPGSYPFRARLNVQFTYGWSIWQGDWHSLYCQQAGRDPVLFWADLGVIRLPHTAPIKGVGRASGQINLLLEVQNTSSGALTSQLIDLVLMPADEWIADFAGAIQDTNDAIGITEVLDVDSATMPAYALAAHRRKDGDRQPTVGDPSIPGTDDLSAWLAHASDPMFLQARSSQRLWFLAGVLYERNSSLMMGWNQFVLSRVQFTGVSRYSLARGNR